MQWIEFLGKFYKEQKAKNPDYKYKDAMTDAVKPYRAQGSAPAVEAPAKKRRGATKKRKGGRGGATKKRRS